MTDTSSTSTTTDTGTSLPLAPGHWQLDPTHSEVGFTIRHLGISKVRGRFTRFEVDLHVGETLAESALRAVVHLASIDTANADRDAHVRSPELLDVARRPTITFESTRITGAGSEWQVEGTVAIGDVTRPATIEVELGGVETYPIDGSRHAGFAARGQVSRKDLGVRFGALDAALGDAVHLDIDVQLVEPR
jgi:polyisoprenoid-binding protein YceI